MRITSRLVLSVLFSTLIFSQCLADGKPLSIQRGAQDFPVRAGNRARLTFGFPGTQSTKRYTGTIKFVKADSVTLEIGHTLKTHARSEILKLEIPNGKRRNILKGGYFGMGVGLATGLVISTTSCDGDYFEDLCKVGTPIAGVAWGFVSGAIVGFFVTSTRWEEVNFNRLELSLAPLHSGAPGFQVSLKF